MKQGISWLKGSLAALGMTLTLAAPAADEAYGGLPRSRHEGTAWDTQVLRNPGFVVGYSPLRRQPLWVAFRAETLKGTGPLPPRPRFEADPRVSKAVGYFDYRGSGYTRGHLAPNWLIGKLYGAAAQRATFLMTNISPQTERLNELVWQRLEQAESDVVAPHAVKLWVVTGPVFGAAPAELRKHIAVPEAFYRIWLDVEGGQPRVLAFIVPQGVCGTEPLSRYLASVDEVERRTGLDFFSELADPQEQALQARAETAGWQLERYDRQPARYAEKFGVLHCPA